MFVSGERWDERGVPIGLGGFVLALQGFGRWVAGMSDLGQSWGFYSILCPYNDSTLRKDIIDKPDELRALVDRFFHCG